MSNGGRLDIAARSQVGEAGAGGVLLEITDSGAGIPAEILPNLCEPFFTTRAEGTGLEERLAQVRQNFRGNPRARIGDLEQDALEIGRASCRERVYSNV